MDKKQIEAIIARDLPGYTFVGSVVNSGTGDITIQVMAERGVSPEPKTFIIRNGAIVK